MTLSPDERLETYAANQMLSRYPISYEGVLSGYKDRARNWEVQAAFGEPDLDLQHYRFWDRFRIASVLGVLVWELGSLSLEKAAFDLVYAYIEMLQGIAYGVVSLDQEGSFLTMDVARKMAASLDPLIERLPNNGGTWMIKRYAELTLERIGYSTG